MRYSVAVSYKSTPNATVTWTKWFIVDAQTRDSALVLAGYELRVAWPRHRPVITKIEVSPAGVLVTEGGIPVSDQVSMAEQLAAKAGTAYGKDAASWALEPHRLTVPEMKRLLKGIQDGDPAIMDGFREPSLNGEFQDAPTSNRVATEAGLNPDTEDIDKAVEAWEEAATSAFWGELERVLALHTQEI